MRAILTEIPEAGRVDGIVRRVERLRAGEILTLVCQDDPTELAAAVAERLGGRVHHQAIHLARKKSPPWLLHLKRSRS